MGIIFSRQCEYALQTVVFLALKPEGEMISIRKISSSLDIPYHFTGKILQDLTHKGLLNSLKGPTGGFSLARSAKSISLLHIVEAIDGVSTLNACVMGFSECSGSNPCAAHSQWEKIRENIYKMLMNKSIYEMAVETKKTEIKSEI